MWPPSGISESKYTSYPCKTGTMQSGSALSSLSVACQIRHFVGIDPACRAFSKAVFQQDSDGASAVQRGREIGKRRGCPRAGRDDARDKLHIRPVSIAIPVSLVEGVEKLPADLQRLPLAYRNIAGKAESPGRVPGSNQRVPSHISLARFAETIATWRFS